MIQNHQESVARFFFDTYARRIAHETGDIRKRAEIPGIQDNRLTVAKAIVGVRQYLATLDDNGGFVLAPSGDVRERAAEIIKAVNAATGYCCDRIITVSLTNSEAALNPQIAIKRVHEPFWRSLQRRQQKLEAVSASTCTYWVDAGEVTFGELASRVLELVQESLPMQPKELIKMLWKNVMAMLTFRIAGGMFPGYERTPGGINELLTVMQFTLPIGIASGLGTDENVMYFATR